MATEAVEDRDVERPEDVEDFQSAEDVPDESGTAAADDEGSGHEDPDDDLDEDEGQRRGRARPWGRIAAFVSLLYVAWYVVGLVVLKADPGAYNGLNRFYGGGGARVVLCGVLLAVLYHLLDGVRVTAQDGIPRLAAHEVALRTAVRFVLLAAWIPLSVAVLWPVIRTWFSR